MVQAQSNRCKFTNRIILVHAPIRHCAVFYNFFIMEENEKIEDSNDRKAAAFAALCAASVAILALCWFLLHISRYESIYEVL